MAHLFRAQAAVLRLGAVDAGRPDAGERRQRRAQLGARRGRVADVQHVVQPEGVELHDGVQAVGRRGGRGGVAAHQDELSPERSLGDDALERARHLEVSPECGELGQLAGRFVRFGKGRGCGRTALGGGGGLHATAWHCKQRSASFDYKIQLGSGEFTF